MTTPTGDPDPRRPAHASALVVVGLLSAAPAILVLLAARLLQPAPGVLEAVADGVLRFLPVGVFDLGIQAFGRLAKGLLFAAVCLGALGSAASVFYVGGRLGLLRRPAVDVGMMLAVVTVALVEIVVLPVSGSGLAGSSLVSDPAAVQVPLVIAAAVFGLAGAALRQIAEPRTAGAHASSEVDLNAGRPSDISRRQLLGRGALIVGFASLAGSAGLIVSRIAQSAAGHVVGATGTLESTGFGVTPAVTPIESFYWVSKDLLPYRVDVAGWRLRVSGLVDHPGEYTLDELRGMPSVEGYRTLQCISNEVLAYGDLIGNQRWRGVRASDIIGAAGAQPSARHVLWRSADGYTESLPLEVALDPRTWLAYEMGPPGTLLNELHGAPVRVLIAGRYGQKQPKYLTEIVLAADDEAGYWVQRGWDRDAVVRTYSRIDFPIEDGISDSILVGRAFSAYGVASAGDRGIRRVEVSLDDGSTWRSAELEPPGGPIGDLTWVRWRLVDLHIDRPGEVYLRVRATDGDGRLQDPEIRPPHPSGATGYHRVLLTAVDVLPEIPTAHPVTPAPTAFR